MCDSLPLSAVLSIIQAFVGTKRTERRRARSLISIVRSCSFRLIHESLGMHIHIVFRATNIIQTRLYVHTHTRAHTHTWITERERRKNRERKISLYFPFANNTPIGHTRNGSKSSFFLFHTVRHIKRADRHCLLIEERCLPPLSLSFCLPAFLDRSRSSIAQLFCLGDFFSLSLSLFVHI